MNANNLSEFNIFAPLPNGTVVLEASAGTGKTWTIAGMVARLIAETDIPVADLLIITFTRAAASELRSRIRERLVELASGLRELAAGEKELTSKDSLLFFLATGQAPTTGVTPAFLASEELAARSSRLELAASELDTATIATIHSFLQAALQGFGVAGDLDAELELEANLNQMREEAAVDTFLELFMDSAQPEIGVSDGKAIAKSAVNNPLAPLYPQEELGESQSVTQARRFATLVRERVERRKHEAGVMGYDDLLVRMAKIVDPLDGAQTQRAQRARDYLRGRWSHVFVDEFQDTDDIQWRILRAVFDGHCNLTLIGDPKQAIYSFRGGDLHTYLAAAQSADRKETLLHNYRSDAPLLAGLNSLFKGADLGDPRIAVPAVESGVEEARVRLAPGQENQRVRLRILDGEGESISAPEIRRLVIADVVADIAHLLTGEARIREGSGATATWRGVEGRDIAVLCHANSDTKRFQEALLWHGINAVRGGGISVFDSEAAEDWFILLRAMDQPSNRRSLAAAALGPFFGQDPHELLANRDATLTHVSEKLRHFTSLLTKHGIASVLEAALGDSESGMAVRVLGRIGGERLLTDLQHLGELMHSAHPRAGAYTLLAWLGQQQENSEQTEYPRRLESDDSAVVISTLHSAKGLEFPFVYLPTTAGETFSHKGLPAQHFQGRRVVPLAKTRPLSSAYTEEQHGERARLQYVGFTRGIGQVTAYWSNAWAVSRKALHRLLLGRVEGFSEKDPAETVVTKLRKALGPEVHVEILTERAAPEVSRKSPTEIGSAREWTRIIDSTWRRSSYTSLAQAAERSSYLASTEPEQHSSLAASTDLSRLPDALAADEWDFKEDPRGLAQTDAASTAATGGATEREVASGQESVPGPGAVRALETVEPLASPMADLPRGAHFGSLVHGILETVDTRAPDLPLEVSQRVREQLHHWPQELAEDALAQAILAVLTTPLHPAVPEPLTAIDPSEKLAELDFEIPLDGGVHAGGTQRVTLGQVAEILRTHLEPSDPLYSYAGVLQSPEYGEQTLRGYLTGSIDLVFGWGGKYYVTDYKTNWLGPLEAPQTTAAYGVAQVRAAMEGSSYPLQALLYTVALHRYLAWRLPDYQPQTHIGGVLYLYVRGMAGPSTPVIEGHSAGIFAWTPPAGLVIALSELLEGTGAGEHG